MTGFKVLFIMSKLVTVELVSIKSLFDTDHLGRLEWERNLVRNARDWVIAERSGKASCKLFDIVMDLAKANRI